MAHVVKCRVCEKRFDRDKIAAVPYGANRYAHATCVTGEYEPSQEEKDLKALHDYLKRLFKDDYNYVALDRQIKSYIKDNEFTISGILKTLVYWYDVKKSSKEPANGRIGIVPYVYTDASKYYYALFMANQSNADKNLEVYKHPEINEVRIKRPERDPIMNTRLFDLED